MSKVYEVVNTRLLEIMEKGVIPWRQSWKGRSKPSNLVSGKPYRGYNFVVTSASGYSSPWWLTYKQASERGGQVKKGEKGTPIIYWSTFDVTDDKKEDKTKKVPFIRLSYVFNSEQCEGLSVPVATAGNKLEPIAACEKVISNLPLGFPKVKHGGERAFYRPLTDKIYMPPMNLFDSAEEYYHVRFHESVHATGHKSRLDRDGVNAVSHYGSETYSFEELVAELGASYLSAECGIACKVIDNAASYLSHWMAFIRKEPQAFIKASGLAQKAVNWMMPQVEETTTEAGE